MAGRHRRPTRPLMRRSTAAGIHYAAAVAALLAALLIYGAESAAVLPCDCPASAPNSFHFTHQPR